MQKVFTFKAREGRPRATTDGEGPFQGVRGAQISAAHDSSGFLSRIQICSPCRDVPVFLFSILYQRVAYGVEVNQRAAALSDEVPLQGNA